MMNRFACISLAVASLALARSAYAECAADADCKNGRVCQTGECVDPATGTAAAATTAATPACAKDSDCKGDRICEKGTCVNPTSSAAPAAAPAGTTAAHDPAATKGEEASTASAGAMKLSRGFVFVPRIGFILTGSSEMDWKGNQGDLSDSETSSSADKSLFVLGLDALYATSPNLRLGLGVLYAPSTKFKKEDDKVRGRDGDEAKVGSDLSLVGVVEPVFPVSPSVALSLRGFAGMLLLFPGGDLGDDIDDNKEACSDAKDAGYIDSCNVSGGPFPGLTLGGGGGVMFNAGSVRPRVDLMFQYYSIGTYEMKASGGGYDMKQETKASGTRLLLTGGLEF